MGGHQVVVVEVRFHAPTARTCLSPLASKPGTMVAAGTTASGSVSSGGTGCFRSASCCAADSFDTRSRFQNRDQSAATAVRKQAVPQISPVITTGSGVIVVPLGFGWQE